ncbi:hypothetical protein L7F22_062038 [Adiantum nelumboides]|nr:hypothetical protein [Adiantum nelumboides]
MKVVTRAQEKENAKDQADDEKDQQPNQGEAASVSVRIVRKSWKAERQKAKAKHEQKQATLAVELSQVQEELKQHREKNALIVEQNKSPRKASSGGLVLAMMEPKSPIPPLELKLKRVGFETPKAMVVETSTQRHIELESQKSVLAKTAVQEANNPETQRDDRVVASTIDDARSQFMAPIPEIEEPWPNELWEDIGSTKEGSATFQSACITKTVQFDASQQPPTILRRPPPPPQPMAAVPPVPEPPEERGVNIIKLEEPEELNVMPAIKRTRAQERDEEMKSDTSDEPKKGKKKVKEDEAESSKKKKSRRPRRVIDIDDFPLDIEPIVDAYIKEKRVSNVYVDGGAQMCVVTERTMHRLGLSITEPSDCHAKLVNNSKVKCLGIIKDVLITVLDVSAKVDFYVMPSKGEGYPLILERPWLMEVNADQKWGSDKLVLQKGNRIVYDMKLGKQSNIFFETSTDEDSSDESSYGDEESYTSEESSMEVMGLVFQQPQAKGSSTSKEVEVVAKEEPTMEERLRKMLSKDLTKEEEEDYINMFKRYPHLFITDYSMIKGVDVIQHHIDLKPDAKPVAQKLRRLGVVQQEALLTEVNKLLKAGFIYPVTNSEWVSPVVVTPKKNGKWRVCVDYKPLNAATKRDHFPLPFQDEILNEVARHERYTVCDSYLGYYQIRIAEEDQHKTTFITPWGCFAFRVMPFGLTNAPSTFTRFTSFIFQPFFGKSIRVFLDDFCTYSDRALHCQRVEEGLQRLYQYGGQLNPDKCHGAEKEVVLLGHVISQEGIKVDPSRVQAILDLPPPNSARQVITFVQKVRYMSRFIHLLSQIISPLQQLANQEVFSWEQEHLECFNEVKEVLGSLPTIMAPNPQGIYYLCPSVGLDAFGAVLMQKDPKTAYMRPIYFTSKVMTQGQKGYTDIEQLVFSLTVAIRKFRSYLLPKPFIILTLEHNLPYAIQHMSISSKISKWVLELQEYEYTFIVEDSTRASLAHTTPSCTLQQ